MAIFKYYRNVYDSVQPIILCKADRHDVLASLTYVCGFLKGSCAWEIKAA